MEQLWYERAKAAIIKNGGFYLSWWLRLDYKSENITTTKINYWLNKSVKKGILRKDACKYFTKYYLCK